MSAIIKLTINNGLIPLQELHSMLTVDKDINETIYTYISMLIRKFIHDKKTLNSHIKLVPMKIHNNHIICSYCNVVATTKVNPFTNKRLCDICISFQLISKSKAKHKYKLTEKELYAVPCCYYYKSSTRLGYYYDINLVFYTYILKIIKNNRDKLTNISKLKQIQLRKNKITYIIHTLDMTIDAEHYNLYNYHVFDKYIHNGTYNLKIIKNMLLKWKEFFYIAKTNEKARIVINEINIIEHFNNFINGEDVLVEMVNDEYDLINSIKEKELKIITELNAYKIHDGYKCDAFYNFIIDKEVSLENSINEIREHHYFTHHTSFIEIREKRLRILKTFLCSENEHIKRAIYYTNNHESKIKALKQLTNTDFIPDFIKMKYLF